MSPWSDGWMERMDFFSSSSFSPPPPFRTLRALATSSLTEPSGGYGLEWSGEAAMGKGSLPLGMGGGGGATSSLLLPGGGGDEGGGSRDAWKKERNSDLLKLCVRSVKYSSSVLFPTPFLQDRCVAPPPHPLRRPTTPPTPPTRLIEREGPTYRPTFKTNQGGGRGAIFFPRSLELCCYFSY